MSKVLTVFACLLALGWSVGAAEAWELTTWRPWPFNKQEKPQQPEKILAIWNDTVLTQANRPPIRGFGGRLMFYAGKGEDPVLVEGTLVVYTFDETARNPNDARPDRKYIITPEQLPAHYSKSKIGHSYSVWIPWDPVGGMQKEITLIVRFEPRNGSAVVGEQCRQVLPGMLPQPHVAQAAVLLRLPPIKGDVQAVSYEAPVPAGNRPEPEEDNRPRQMTTTTIPLSPGMASRCPAMTMPAAPSAGDQQRAGPGAYSPPTPWSYSRGVKEAPAGPTAPPQPPSSSWLSSSRPRFGSALDRLWPLGKPLVRLNRDRAPSPPSPVESSSGPGPQPGTERANAAPAGPSDAAPARN
jgi:hypothetical protein